MGQLTHASLQTIEETLEVISYGDLETDDVLDILLRLTVEILHLKAEISALQSR